MAASIAARPNSFGLGPALDAPRTALARAGVEGRRSASTIPRGDGLIVSDDTASKPALALRGAQALAA